MYNEYQTVANIGQIKFVSRLIGTLAIVFSSVVGYSQSSIPLNKYGLAVISEPSDYQQTILQNPVKKMTELKTLISSIRYELRYATRNNFMKRRMYPRSTAQTYLRQPAAYALRRADSLLKKKGYRLKIFDAYRPYSVTEKFWELVRDDRYVADPSKGSGHNRGLSVDLTIVDARTGKELNMGTDFDNFSDTAHHSFQFQIETIKFQNSIITSNRKLLKETMESVGFKSLETEWWHYSWPNDQGYEILDVSFEELRTLSVNAK
jgi:zinc D-Ala-D-Ala dipeptidase